MKRKSPGCCTTWPRPGRTSPPRPGRGRCRWARHWSDLGPSETVNLQLHNLQSSSTLALSSLFCLHCIIMVFSIFWQLPRTEASSVEIFLYFQIVSWGLCISVYLFLGTSCTHHWQSSSTVQSDWRHNLGVLECFESDPELHGTYSCHHLGLLSPTFSSWVQPVFSSSKTCLGPS